jgi:hypothetical protein
MPSASQSKLCLLVTGRRKSVTVQAKVNQCHLSRTSTGTTLLILTLSDTTGVVDRLANNMNSRITISYILNLDVEQNEKSIGYPYTLVTKIQQDILYVTFIHTGVSFRKEWTPSLYFNYLRQQGWSSEELVELARIGADSPPTGKRLAATFDSPPVNESEYFAHVTRVTERANRDRRGLHRDKGISGESRRNKTPRGRPRA